MSDAIRTGTSHGGAVRTLTVDRPPGNVLNIDTCRQLTAALQEAAADREAKLLVVRGAGKHFSFGASVEDHLPENAREMLEAIGSVFRGLAGFPYPTLAAVQGRCLGGGLELALACGQVFAEEGAIFAAAEIRLGVFAPAATAFLQRGVATAIAEEILLTGRDFSAQEAFRFGLVNRIVPAGELDATVESWAQDYFVPRSAASLRVATQAIRQVWQAGLDQRLAAAEDLYLTDLLELHDGSEGIRAFMEKRAPQWKNN